MFRHIRFLGMVAAFLSVSVSSAEIGFVEDFALAADREAALRQLIPGSEDYYYYRCLLDQNAGRLDAVDQTLAAWVKRYGTTTRAAEIRRRQMLLKYDQDPQATLDYLKLQVNARLDHQREIVGEKPKNPTALDPKLIARETLVARALASRGDLAGFTDSGLELLADQRVDADRRRMLLQRLKVPDFPGLVKLVADDLAYRDSSGFGSLEIHRQLLSAQLEELLALRPQLLNETNFVNITISKLGPGADSEWRRDANAREAYLDRLWAFVQKLAPAHNSLKVHVLFHRLQHDRGQGVYDKARFMEYLKLPRPAAGYVNPAYLAQPECRNYPADVNADFLLVTGLPPVRLDELLVRQYFMHFFVAEEGYEPYQTHVRDSYLKAIFAETKILNGLGDMEKWYALLNDPGLYQQLKERVEIEFAPHNRTQFLPADPVALDVDIKNVKTLMVKVFEINTGAYYRDKQEAITTAMELDGLTAGKETTYTYDDPPLRRVRRHFEFPELNRRGVFVIEFIGNGSSSRALIRKGQLTFLERLGAAGHVFTVLDEQRRQVPDASVWLAGHEFKADKDGTVTVPYTTKPGKVAIIIETGGFATLEFFYHQAEAYALAAGIYVDWEALIRDHKAQVLVRPDLRLNGEHVALALLEEPVLEITSFSADGTKASRRVTDLVLTAEREYTCEIQVPDNVSRLSFGLQGHVQCLSLNKKVPVRGVVDYHLNGVNATPAIADLFLSREQGGYALRMLGKIGEPKADRAVMCTLRMRDFADPVRVTLQTDAAGRVMLGELPGVEELSVSSPGTGNTADAVNRQWNLLRDWHSVLEQVHAGVGTVIQVPYMGSAREVTPAAFALFACCGSQVPQNRQSGTIRRQDWLKAVTLKDGFLELAGLPAGDYELLLKETGEAIAVRVGAGDLRRGYVVGASRMLQVRNQAPLQIVAVDVAAESLRLRLANVTAATRVHLTATRFLPEFSLSDAMAAAVTAGVQVIRLPQVESVFVSGRDIGDEYRYILERKYAQKLPGNMLQRPGLLLNPWALRTTETDTYEVKAGSTPLRLEGLYGGRASSRRDEAVDIRGLPDSREGERMRSCLDYLAQPGVLLANLVPDKDGVVTVPRQALGNGQHLRIVAVNPDNVVRRDIALGAMKLTVRDLRLAQSADPAAHFSEQKQVTRLLPQQKLEIKDAATAKVEAYTTVADVYRLYTALSHDPALAEFSFITTWNTLKPAEQREKYAKYACHELNFFLYKKDPAFFETVVQPYLRNKKDKTVLDKWLIGDDLRAFLEPWAYGRLNIAERVLLGQRIAAEKAAAAQHIKDLLALLPPDLERRNTLFLTAVQSSALDASAARAVLGRASTAPGETESESLDVAGSANAGPAAAAPAPPAVAEAKKAAAPGAMPPAKLRSKDQAARKAAEVSATDDDGVADTEESVVAGGRARDASRRADVRQLFRQTDKTQEWAENNYWQRPQAEANAGLVTVNAFWLDAARHPGDSPFLSAHFAEASRNFTEMMFAMALLDLPFAAPAPEVVRNGAAATLTAKTPGVVFHQEIKPAVAAPNTPPVLVNQNFFRASDRYREENGEKVDKYVSDEFLGQVLYGCQVAVTNPTSARQKLEVLLQVPQGSVPACGSQYTRSLPVALEPYATITQDYYFYFPQAGQFPHFPVHVARNGALVAAAAPVTLKVVDKPTRVDTASWDFVSQDGTPEDVLAFLARENPNRLNLERIAWRLRDPAFFGKVIDLLTRRHVYSQKLWAYGLLHRQPVAIREFLAHEDAFAAQCGASLASPLLTIDPVVRGSYQHLEYSPLVNTRAHQVGKRRQILNSSLLEQYQAFMNVLAYRAQLTDADCLDVTYYLLLQDRVEDARRFFARVDPKKAGLHLQYDYLQVYLDFYSKEHKLARALAQKYSDYPVDRWRHLFREALVQLDEIEGVGKPVGVTDKESRDQQQAQLAATEPALDFTVEARQFTINYQNLAECRVNYYFMDVELLFSRNPFVQQGGSQFSYVQPNRSDTLKLPAGKATTSVELPAELKNANVLIELRAAGLRKAQVCFANSLTLQVVENYGQVRVISQKGNVPLPQVYVKVYARGRNGEVKFFKDGYTDLRGRFDYASVSTNALDDVERLAILVLSDTDGAVIREVAPPKQ